jgi:hypothetical protein
VISSFFEQSNNHKEEIYFSISEHPIRFYHHQNLFYRMSRLIKFAKGVVRPLVAQQSNIIFRTAAPSFTFQFKSFSGEAGKDEVILLF